MNGKLEDIGKRSGVTPDDIRQIRSNNRKAMVFFFLGGALLALLAFIIGLILGWFTKKDTGGGAEDPGPSTGGGYPFAISATTIVGGMKHSKPSRVMLLILALSAFFAGFTAPVFGQAIDYGVYERS